MQRPVFDDRDCIQQEVDQRHKDFADKAYRYFEENLAEKYQDEIKPSYLVLCSSGFYLFSFYLTRSTHPELIFKLDEDGRVVDFGTYPEYESLPAKLSQRVGENICIEGEVGVRGSRVVFYYLGNRNSPSIWDGYVVLNDRIPKEEITDEFFDKTQEICGTLERIESVLDCGSNPVCANYRLR